MKKILYAIIFILGSIVGIQVAKSTTFNAFLTESFKLNINTQEKLPLPMCDCSRFLIWVPNHPVRRGRMSLSPPPPFYKWEPVTQWGCLSGKP